MRADSGFYAHTVVAACREMDVRFSITIRQRASLRDLIEAIPEEDWTPIPYWMDGAADVAETTYTPFQTKPDARLVAGAAHRPAGEADARFPARPLRQIQLSRTSSPTAMGRRCGTGGRSSPPRRGRERHTRPQVRRRAEPHAVGALRRQRRLAGGPGYAPSPGPLDGADRSGRADSHHQDPQAACLSSGTAIHPVGTPPHFASPPALALGNPVQSRLGPAASHSVPGLTASLQLTQRPRNLAPPRSRESPAAYPLAIPRIATPA